MLTEEGKEWECIYSIIGTNIPHSCNLSIIEDSNCVILLIMVPLL
jgi:hypothetical protein